MEPRTEPQAITLNQATHPTPPAPGEYWPGQGGIYVGIARGEPGHPPYHLILAEEAPKTKFTWQAAMDFAKTITADGHTDFVLPTRFESALLYANVHDKIDDDYWYWTSTVYGKASAWLQFFFNGRQLSYVQSDEFRARAVRRLNIQSFSASEVSE